MPLDPVEHREPEEGEEVDVVFEEGEEGYVDWNKAGGEGGGMWYFFDIQITGRGKQVLGSGRTLRRSHHRARWPPF